MTPTEQQNKALAAFVACVVAGLNPSIHAHTHPRNGEATYDLLIGGTGNGILHEQITDVLRIATEHGARAFIHHADQRCGNCYTAVSVGEGCLSIVWPGRRPSGPSPEDEHDQQAAQGRRRPRKEVQR